MAIDFKRLKNKLDKVEKNNDSASKNIWRPKEGYETIRLVPLAKNPTYPFQELYFYYPPSGTTISPISIGKPDPIKDFGDELRKGGMLPKEEYLKTKQFFPVLRTFAPIVVRGKENEGVKFWGFGKDTLAKLIKFMTDEELGWGDITDPVNGHDLRIEYIPKEKSSTNFPKINVDVIPRVTPLSADETLRNKLLTEQPDIFDSYEMPSESELKELLQKMIEANIDEEPGVEQHQIQGALEESSESSEVVKNVAGAFDSLFNK